MKILCRDLKRGLVRVRIENLDDLWYLSSVVHVGDLVKSKTERRIKAKEDIGRSKSGKRKVITIAVRVKKADFRSDADTLRISGIIVSGPGDLVSIGSYHTFNVEKGTLLSIIKDRWSRIELNRLREAEKASLRPKILIAVIDSGEATFGFVRESKIEYFDLSRIIGGKYDLKGREGRRKEFYGDAARFISDTLKRENISAVIVAGAGFEKEHFYRFLSEQYPDIAKKSVLENIGSYGRNGVGEVLKRQRIKDVVEDITSASDIRLVHQLLKEIGTDSGLAEYGLKDIRDAVNVGSVSKLIICDSLFLSRRGEIEPLMNAVRSRGGGIHLINTQGEAGKQLHALGGIGAILRYQVKKNS